MLRCNVKALDLRNNCECLLRYVHFSDPRYPPLLFDMEADGGSELTDLASSEEAKHRAALLDCMTKLLGWRMRHAEHVLTHFNNSDAGSLQVNPILHATAAAAAVPAKL